MRARSKPSRSSPISRSAEEPRKERVPAPRTLIGEVLDTHHPDLPGRVLVQWQEKPRHDGVSRWLEVLRGCGPRQHDHVLLQQPANWPEWIVVGVLSREVPEADASTPTAAPPLRLELELEQCVQVVASDGSVLVEIRQSNQGPQVKLLQADVSLELPAQLQLRASKIVLEAGVGGIDLRTGSDVTVRGRAIRLN